MEINTPLNKKFLLPLAGFLLAGIVLQFVIIINAGFNIRTAFTDSLVSNLIMMASGFVIINNLRYARPGTSRNHYVLLSITFISVISVSLTYWLLSKLQTSIDYRSFLSETLLIRFCFCFLVNGWMGMMSWMWFAQQEKEEAERRKAMTEKLAKEAELQRLQQQLQPHFLFNSLNSISALAITNPTEARRMIQQLSDFLRSTLRKNEQEQIPLKEEFQHLELYLEIEKVRFGHRLETAVITTTTADNCSIPPLLLQPIVENAIKFGLYDTTGDVTISIDAKYQSSLLIITIANPFDAEMTKIHKGTGFGLDAVKRRLYLLFARHDLLETTIANNLFMVTIKIPQIQYD